MEPRILLLQIIYEVIKLSVEYVTAIYVNFPRLNLLFAMCNLLASDESRNLLARETKRLCMRRLPF